ncbi:MAG TPA: ATP-binding protein [Gemmatimonadales bacterium]
MHLSGPRSLRTELLVELGFVTSAAVLLVGLTTMLLLGGDVREAFWPLMALWGGSTVIFVLFGAYVVHRLVIQPLGELAGEADQLAAGEPLRTPVAYQTRELGELAGRYRSMAEDLLDMRSHAVRVEKLAGIGCLAAGVAHEVRNPLGALGTYVEVLRQRGSDPDVTSEMHTAIGRVDRIVQGLLDYARPSDRGPGCADLSAVVETAVGFLERQGLLEGRKLSLNVISGLPPVQGDRHGLEQVVINLLLNAHQASVGTIALGAVGKVFEPAHRQQARSADKYGSPGTRQRTRAPEPRRRDLEPGMPGALIYVADDGPGVPDRDRERIFDPFFTTKPPGRGTGLGLAIVARTVYDAGGVVWVDRAREGGAVFKVFLPLAGATDARADR